MTTAAAILVLAAFPASAVEGVEALTVVLAAGTTRGWRSALIGAAAAILALAAVIAAIEPSLSSIPMEAFRAIVGALLLVFGLEWLRKTILRAGGYQAPRDEDALVVADLDLDMIREVRNTWQFFRDRRPESYGQLVAE